MRYRLERSRELGVAWQVLLPCDATFHPKERGFVGSSYGERLRFICRGAENEDTVEVWQWSPSVPVNPADLSCTDFKPGWKLISRKNSPVLSDDELSVFYIQGVY